MSDFDCEAAARLARTLIHTTRDAALGTIDKSGSPNLAHTAFAVRTCGQPLIIMSDLAVHTHNVRRDPRASLLIVGAAGETSDTKTRPRVALSGRVAPVSDRAAMRARYLRKQPEAELYIDFGDMHLMEFTIERAHLVGGFARATTVAVHDITSEDTAARSLEEIDASACQHMDEDHADALARYADLPGEVGHWRTAGCDPRGIDLIRDDGAMRRAEFPAPLESAAGLRFALKDLSAPTSV